MTPYKKHTVLTSIMRLVNAPARVSYSSMNRGRIRRARALQLPPSVTNLTLVHLLSNVVPCPIALQSVHHIQWTLLMRRAEILTGDVIALILLAVVCIPGNLSFLLGPTAGISTTFHSSFESGHLAFRFMGDIKQAFNRTIASNC